MRLYSDVDELGRRAFELHANPGGVRALNLWMLRGSRHRGCRGLWIVTIVGDRSRPGRWSPKVVCARCGAARTAEANEDVHVLRGSVQATPRRDAAEDSIVERIDEWRRLEEVVFPRPRGQSDRRWAFALEAWRLWLHAGVGGYCGVAAYGAAAAPRFAGLWTPAIVGGSIRTARKIVGRRARRRPRLLLDREAG